MDDLADMLKMDPTALHLLNCIRPDDVLEIEGNSVDFTKVGGSALIEAIQKGMTASDWTAKRAQNTASNAGTGHVRRGIGMALLTYGFGHIPDSANVNVSINQGGRVQVTAGMADLGGGQPTTISMLVAEVLGANLSDVSMSLGDTQYPAAPLQGTFGSRTVHRG